MNLQSELMMATRHAEFKHLVKSTGSASSAAGSEAGGVAHDADAVRSFLDDVDGQSCFGMSQCANKQLNASGGPALIKSGPMSQPANKGKTFSCLKCKQALPFTEMSSRSNVCQKDNASHSSMYSRTKASKPMLLWWNGLGAEGQRLWYMKQQTMGPGKRTWDEISYTEESVQETYQDENEVDTYKTWKNWKREGMSVGCSVKQLEEEFVAMVHNPQVGCLFRRGQWLVPEFDGV
jgi:hypothetical protein